MTLGVSRYWMRSTLSLSSLPNVLRLSGFCIPCWPEWPLDEPIGIVRLGAKLISVNSDLVRDWASCMMNDARGVIPLD